jgi:hypothetical protein
MDGGEGNPQQKKEELPTTISEFYISFSFMYLVVAGNTEK